jgi:4-aminobutyrate aminotransferase-like enzyme
VPLGAVATRDDIAGALREGGFMFFTFTGNDAACAAGACVLDILEREALVDRAATLGAVLGSRLRDALAGNPLVSDVRGRGMFYGVELQCNRDAVVAAALARDLWVYPAGSGPVPNAILVAPPFVITEAEIDQLIERLVDALDAVST